MLNKVAGVYGLIAMLTGSGGSFAQLSLYVYSVVALIALVWGLRAVKNVRSWPSQTPYLMPISYTGGLEANTLLCTPLLRRPRILHGMDGFLRARLVALDLP